MYQTGTRSRTFTLTFSICNGYQPILKNVTTWGPCKKKPEERKGALMLHMCTEMRAYGYCNVYICIMGGGEGGGGGERGYTYVGTIL